MNMKLNMKYSACMLALLIASPAMADELLRASRSWDEGHIAYPSGTPEITSRILRIEDQQEVPFHCHPVPTMGYVLNGTVEVETSSGRTASFSAGDALIEVMNTPHRGKAIGGPVEIVVFYAGAQGLPNTLVPDGDNMKSCTSK
jgi:quercetin dioxygenase-like cupin family protein